MKGLKISAFGLRLGIGWLVLGVGTRRMPYGDKKSRRAQTLFQALGEGGFSMTVETRVPGLRMSSLRSFALRILLKS